MAADCDLCGEEIIGEGVEIEFPAPDERGRQKYTLHRQCANDCLEKVPDA